MPGLNGLKSFLKIEMSFNKLCTLIFYREQQYVQMWAELEAMVRAHSDTSPMHQKVLECLLECKKPSDDAKARKQGDKITSREEKMDVSEMENTWKELDRYLCFCSFDRYHFLITKTYLYNLDPLNPTFI